MIMMLPFLTGFLAAWFGVRGRRAWSIALWVVTLVLLAAWSAQHMTDPLPLSF